MAGSTDATGSDKSAKGAGSSKPAKTAGSGQSPAKAAVSVQPPAKAAGSGQPPAKTVGSNSAPPKPNTANPPPANSGRRPPTPETSQSESKKRAAPPGSATPSSGTSQSFCSGKAALRLFTRDNKFPSAPSESEKLEPGPLLDERSKFAMAHCFHVALALLENSTGHDAFVKVAKRIVTERRHQAKDNTPEPGLFAGKDINDMPKYINDFLKKVREIGLPVCVARGVKGHYGLSQRLSWGFDMDKYDPKTAAIVYLSKGMVEGLLEAADAVQNSMVQQRNINADIQKGVRKAEDAATKVELQSHRKTQEYAQKSFERAIFCMSVTLAHEFVHCFTGYLSGRTGVRTPPLLPPLGPYGNRDEGEAGWEWCNLTFGGLAHFFYTKGSPEPFKSGYYIGIPALLILSDKEWKKNSRMYRVDHALVKKIIEMKDWESAYKADPKWMHKIRAQDDQGVLYPEWQTTYNSVVKIWNKYYGIPDVASGKAVEMGQEADIKFASALDAVQKQITKPLAATDIPKLVKA